MTETTVPAEAMRRFRHLETRARDLNTSANTAADRERAARIEFRKLEAELAKEVEALRFVRPRREPHPLLVEELAEARRELEQLEGRAAEASAKWKQTSPVVEACRKVLEERGAFRQQRAGLVRSNRPPLPETKSKRKPETPVEPAPQHQVL